MAETRSASGVQGGREAEAASSVFAPEPILTLSDQAPVPLGGRWSVLRTWTRTRRGIAATVAVLAAAALVFANGAFDGAALPGALWTGLLVLAGSAAVGLLIGSFVGAPIGAEATMCDLRGPLFGMMGLLLATTQGQQSTIVQMFAGLSLDTIRFVVQPVVGIAAVALMATALSGRLRLERDALADPANAEACATCVPLVPRRRA